MKNDYYVYLHKDTTGVVFYVGKGRLKRAYEKSGRSTRWNEKSKEGFSVCIVKDNLSEKEALSLEIDLLAEYDNLVNYHKGAYPIQHTREEYQNYFVVDTDSPSGLSRIKGVWNGNFAKGILGHCGFKRKRTNLEYWAVKFKNKTVPIHRILWTILKGEIPQEYVIDHINGDSLDNSIENLRLVTQEVNTRNKKKSDITPFTKAGVTLDRWSVRAMVAFNGVKMTKRFSMGRHGLLPAFALACQWREDKIKELNEQGAGYTERHGT